VKNDRESEVEDKKRKRLKREVKGGRKKENKIIVAFQIS
jgi:hypothetical protein